METKTDRLFIIIPAYNERENIRQVLDDWYPVIQAHSGNGESRLVVIDDGSKDDTYIIMQEYAKEFPYCLVARDQLEYGYAELSTYNQAEVQKAIDDAISYVMTDQQDVESALATAQQTADGILQAYR